MNKDVKFGVGSKVKFAIADDIECLIVGYALGNAETQYHVVWFSNGDRKCDWVYECELK